MSSPRVVVRWVALFGWLALGACRPSLKIGETEEVKVQSDCPEVKATVECPMVPWGAPVVFRSPEEARSLMVGRWLYCGGERVYTGRGFLEGFFGGTGVEFWEEGGDLHYSFLGESEQGNTRRVGPWSQGIVHLTLEGGQARADLIAQDGQKAFWKIDVFDGKRVLRNSAFDVLHFIPEGK